MLNIVKVFRGLLAQQDKVQYTFETLENIPYVTRRDIPEELTTLLKLFAHKNTVQKAKNK